MQKKKIEDATQRQIAEFLPVALESALASYRQFSGCDNAAPGQSKDAKEFRAHHDACKVAISHIELLIELARWADLPDAECPNALGLLLQSANVELEGHSGLELEDDDGDSA